MEKRGISIIGMILRLAVLMGLTFARRTHARAEVEPWKERRNASIVDAYELNSIDWEAMLKDKRIAGFIAKASDGLRKATPVPVTTAAIRLRTARRCGRKYAVSRELYQTPG